jgi:hypothetical protein
MRVMPGLVPGIHVFKFGKQDVPPGRQLYDPFSRKPGGVDGRDKPGHDE